MNIQIIFNYTVIIAAVVCFIVKLIFNIKENGLEKTVKELILDAESTFQHGQNDEKMNYCIQKFIEALPFWMQKIATYNNIRHFIQDVFDGIKEAMDYNALTATGTNSATIEVPAETNSNDTSVKTPDETLAETNSTTVTMTKYKGDIVK
jgi:hypothetical protein